MLGDIAFVVCLLLAAFIILVGIPYTLYWIPKRIGYPKVGKVLSRSLLVLYVLLFFYCVFEDKLFFKSDARKLLAEQDVVLLDDFYIRENVVSSAFARGYYHSFTINISARDKQRIINQIKYSPGFIDMNGYPKDITLLTDRYFGKRINQNYEDSIQFIREYFKPSGEKGYAPTYRMIKVPKTANQLIFEDLD